MSAQNELPPGWDDSDFDVGKRRDAQLLVAWTHWERESGITREELATMRAAVERLREVEATLGPALFRLGDSVSRRNWSGVDRTGIELDELLSELRCPS